MAMCRAAGWAVSIQSVTPDIAASLGLKSAKGALIAEVVPGGPAAKAGFQQGDIITPSTARPSRTIAISPAKWRCCARARAPFSPSCATASR